LMTESAPGGVRERVGDAPSDVDDGGLPRALVKWGHPK